MWWVKVEKFEGVRRREREGGIDMINFASNQLSHCIRAQARSGEKKAERSTKCDPRDPPAARPVFIHTVIDNSTDTSLSSGKHRTFCFCHGKNK